MSWTDSKLWDLIYQKEFTSLIKELARVRDAVLPDGWAWQRLPDKGVEGVLKCDAMIQNFTPALYKKHMKALHEWAMRYDLGIAPHEQAYLAYGRKANYTWWQFRVQRTTNKTTMPKVFGNVLCGRCGMDNEPNAWECAGCSAILVCYWCSNTGVSIVKDGNEIICGNCWIDCSKCKGACHPSWDTCFKCGPRGSCNYCGNQVSGADYKPMEWYPNGRDNDNNGVGERREIVYCKGCREHVCVNCCAYSRRDLRKAKVGMVCTACWARWFDPFGKVHEEFDEEAELAATRMIVSPMAGREHIRDVGIEIEGGGNTNELCRALYAQGLSPYDRIARYHTSGSYQGFPCHIEQDASVDWEMVIQRFNPSNVEAMRKVNNILKVTRGLIREGKCFLDLRCGCHIHVSANQMSMPMAHNLNNLFAYMEDPIFRIAAAKWGVHRSCRYGTENGAPASVIKDKNVASFSNKLRMDGSRYYAINFQPYLAAHGATRHLDGGGRCRCGAVAGGMWERCTCDLGKCTVEFRVFNSTVNPRKLNAYIALSQALVAKAITVGEFDMDIHAPMEWNVKPVKDMTEAQIKKVRPQWEERLTYMFKELPLSGEEKESLMYCVHNSDMAAAVGNEFLNALV